MRAPFLMGLIGGQRAMTPLAAVAIAGARGELADDNGAPPLLDHPLVAVGALALAIGEMAGDKQATAPDRIVAIGLAARFTTAAIGGLTAVVASYPGWRARCASMARYGQAPTGFVEDAAVLAGAAAIVRSARGRRAV